MALNVITNNHGICITCKGHTLVVRDTQSETVHMAAATLDKCIFEELQKMCCMATHMVADMSGDRAYTVAVFLANLFGGDAREFTLPFDVPMPNETETRQ